MSNKIALKNICFVLASTNLGGAEKQAIFLGKELKERFSAHVFFVLLGDGKGLSRKYLDILDIESFVLKKNQWPLFPRLACLNNVFRLFTFLCGKKIDVILPYTYEVNLYVGLICRVLKIKVAIWNQRDAGLGVKLSFQVRCALKSFDCFISNSQIGCEYLKSELKIKDELIYLVYNGKNPSEQLFTPNEWRNKLGYKLTDTIVVMVSNIQKNKDHNALIDIWNEVKNDSNMLSDIYLLVVGRFGDTYESIKDKVKELGLTESVQFCGEVEDISGLYKATDIAMMVSKSEGFPNVVLEAMEAGLPVVGTCISGICDVVGEEMEQFLFPVGDKKKAASILKMFISNSSLRKEVGSKNKCRALECYSIDNLVNNSIAIISRYLD